MAYGKTLLMRNIRKPAKEWIHQHFVPEVKSTSTAKHWAAKADANLQPYVNPARDLRPGRRLRAELREVPDAQA